MTFFPSQHMRNVRNIRNPVAKICQVFFLFALWLGASASSSAASFEELLKADSDELKYYAKYRINPVNPYLGRNPPITLKVLENLMAEEEVTRQDPVASHMMMQTAFQYRMDAVAQGMSGWDALNTAIGLYESYGKKYPLLQESLSYWLELSNLYLTGRYYLKYDRAFTTLAYQYKDRFGADMACFRFSHELYHPANTSSEVAAYYKACRDSGAMAFLRNQAEVDYKAFIANGRRVFKDPNDRRRFKP